MIVRLLADVKTIGLENIPEHGGALICVNHLSVIDPVIIFIHLKRQDVSALIATKHRKNLLFRMVVDAANGIWLNREEADAQAIRAAVNYMKNGGMLGIAPEGTRSKTGGLLPGKPGVAYLASKAQVPVVPIAISGADQVKKSFQKLRRPQLSMVVGKPFLLPPVERRNRDASLEKYTEEIMCQIAALLPPSYRGVYANYPRVSELEALNQRREMVSR